MTSGDAPPPARGAAIRAFVALPLPEPLRDGVAETIARLERSIRDARFARPDGLHVTLRFLGWTRAERLAALDAPLAAAAQDCPPSTWRFEGWARSRRGAARASSG